VENDTARTFAAVMACLLLIAVLFSVILLAKYNALVDEAQVVCQTAAALDLTKWIDLCRHVNFQE
jgi:general stress protein CsbA